jgi:2-keto-4-pentenoate hydratase/2-oxohepta-3-ene-1,7-dioic acid hydratase in catechol pathway
MIGRFRLFDEVVTGTVQGDRVVVERGLYSDTYTMDELEILPPVTPSKIVCVGLNYTDHARELEMELPGYPIIFMKPPSAVVGHGDMIVYPPESRHVDYEAELAVVIGKRCKHVPAKYAGDVILGFTCFNDVTARDIQQEDGQWTRAKSFDTFAPVGPFVVMAENVDISNAYIRSRVNGQLRQDSSVNNMIFEIPALIEFISHIMTLEKGDIIATGTPAGVGQLYPGDTVEIDIEGVGTLKNKVVKP